MLLWYYLINIKIMTKESELTGTALLYHSLLFNSQLKKKIPQEMFAATIRHLSEMGKADFFKPRLVYFL